MKNKEIVYIHRNPQLGYSIQTVFQNIQSSLSPNWSIENLYVPYVRGNVYDVLRNLLFVFRHRKKNVIYHISGDIHYVSLVLPQKQTIITVHDVGLMDIYRGLKRISYFLLRILPLKKCKYVTCVSSYTKTQLERFIKQSRQNQFLVINNPLNSYYDFIEKKFDSQKPTILHIGTSKNKNLFNSILALKGLRVHLRIIGKIPENILYLLTECHIEYSNNYGLSDVEIMKEYQKADIINFPSTFEGFGMPIIEGQAIGRVVITSNIEPMSSVAADGDYLVNPYDVHSITKAYLEVINNEELRNLLIKNGLKNSLKYKSEIIANQYEKLYESC